MIIHKLVKIGEKGVIHTAQNGSPAKPSILFLHGWPENWRSFENLLELAGEIYYAIAIDLPGIGDSNFMDAPFLKSEIAATIHELVNALKLNDLVIAGQDVGGQVVFSYLHKYHSEIRGAIIMDVVIPGLKPWEDVIRNPYIWHFAFHAIPDLPEAIVTGKQSEYFDYFYNTIAAHSERITSEIKEDYVRSYSIPASLSTGFNWYRGYNKDAEYNKSLAGSGNVIATPLLYMRGEKSRGKIEEYITGLSDSGIRDIRPALVYDCGHFMAEEQPEDVWKKIDAFIKSI